MSGSRRPCSLGKLAGLFRTLGRRAPRRRRSWRARLEDALRVPPFPAILREVEPLPLVDDHRVRVDAPPERTWDAVLELARRRLTRPAPGALVALWRLEPESGFAIVEETPPRRLVLRGRHRFSTYEVIFSIEPGPTGSLLSARTSAVFPGVAGRAYRAVVIGSGGHGVVVRRVLARIARSAERRPQGG